MMSHDARGFLRLGAGLTFAMAALVAVSFAFLSFMKMTMLERADLELHREMDAAMHMIAADAKEAASFETHAVGDDVHVIFWKARKDASGETAVTYATRRDGARVKLGRSRKELAFQPLTGDSVLADVTIQAFRVETLHPGCLHVELIGMSRRTRHRYKQTAEFILEAKR